MKKCFKVSNKYLEEQQNIMDRELSITCLLEKVFDKILPSSWPVSWAIQQQPYEKKMRLQLIFTL